MSAENQTRAMTTTARRDSLWTRVAGWRDASTVLRILRTAGAPCAPGDRRAWGETLPGLGSQLRDGQVRLAMRGDQAVGTFTLTWSAPELWGSDRGDAGYLHRFVVAPGESCEAVGARMLHAAGLLVADRGGHWLRVDCDNDDRGLRAYLEEHGFRHAGDVEGARRGARSGPRIASRYQRFCGATEGLPRAA